MMWPPKKSNPKAGQDFSVSGVKLFQLPGNDVVIEPQHRTSRRRRLAEHQGPGGFDHEAAQQIGDEGFAVLVHLQNFIGCADGQARLGRAVGHGPGGKVAEVLHDFTDLEIVDFLQHIFQRDPLKQKFTAGLPLRIGPGSAAFLLQRVEEQDQWQLDAREDIG
jgi:hypothetical protein